MNRAGMSDRSPRKREGLEQLLEPGPGQTSPAPTPKCMRRGTWTATARPTIRGTSGRSAVSGAVAGRGQRRSGELAGEGASTPRRPGADCGGGGRPGAGGSHLHRVGAHDGTARCSHSAAVTRRPGRGQGDQGARDVPRCGHGRGPTRCAEARACRRTADGPDAVPRRDAGHRFAPLLDRQGNHKPSSCRKTDSSCLPRGVVIDSSR